MKDRNTLFLSSKIGKTENEGQNQVLSILEFEKQLK